MLSSGVAGVNSADKSISALSAIDEQPQMALLTDITKDELARKSDIDAVRLFGAIFPSELSHLKNACATVESGPATTLGRLGDHNQETPSKVLFGQDFAEVNRTIGSILALKWLLADDYESFTACQHSRNRLTEGSFRQLREFCIQRLPNADALHVLLAAMVIDDLGKDPHLAEEVEQATGESLSGPNPADHSVVVFKAARAGLVPALQMLPACHQNDVLRSLELGSKLNISQLVQAECPPGSLNVLLGVQKHERGYSVRTMVTLLDVAGAGGHADTRGCVVMTEPVFRAYMTMIGILDDFVNGRILSQRACYDRILAARAEVLQQQGFDLQSTTIDEERALLRLLCMGRVDSKEQAASFKLAFNQLPPATKQDLVYGLSVDGVNDGVAVIPYYAPGLLADALKNTADSTEASATRALTAFMQFLARVFDGSTPQPGTPGALVERDLSFVQGTIKSSSFRHNPDILDEVALPWKQ